MEHAVCQTEGIWLTSSRSRILAFSPSFFPQEQVNNHTNLGGLGVTLTAANNVIFYDNDWNPTMDAQATDRAHRIGQTRDVYVYQLVTMGTIEDRIVKRAEQKKTVQSTVYEGAALNIFKKDMIMELMADELGVEQNEENKKDEVTKKRGPKATKPTIGVTKDKITAV